MVKRNGTRWFVLMDLEVLWESFSGGIASIAALLTRMSNLVSCAMSLSAAAFTALRSPKSATKGRS